MNIKVYFLLLVVLIFSCNKQRVNNDIIDYVNPLIGTDGHGHTYPGATSPFGMVQLSPDTRLDGWDGCSGYHYSDSVIYGFSHTHLSGTGVSDYGDILLMPISGDAVYNNADYSSSFSHNNEKAEAGYYNVLLDKHNIRAELTTSTRTGFHRYKFADNSDNKVVIDLNHRDVVLDSYIHQINDSTIEGYRISKAWATKQSVYFYIQFSQKIDKLEIFSNDSLMIFSELNAKDIVSTMQFTNILNKELLIKVGISAVDLQGAKNNLLEENPHWDFDSFKDKNQENWRSELKKIEIEDNNESRKTVFYTALYHNMIVPNTFSDVDGRYRGMDMKIHNSKITQYTIFSLWDTYRATHPLYTIIETKRTADFINTFQNQYRDGGILPIWELAANYTNCMIGYHSIPVITDAYFKGLTDIDVDSLLKMVLVSANRDDEGLNAYRKNGYISIEDDAESISKTLEYAYDDWCIAQIAKAAGEDSIYMEFMQRAQSYKNIFDPSIGYMRPKLNQIWKEPFDPSEVDFNYTEANSWQYSFYAPQDIFSLIEMMGGQSKFEKQLDDLFTASTETTGREQSDITGLIGQYAHGNEPSHHMAYLYNYVNKAGKTQKYVQKIVDELYSNNPDGLCGNEDCGQMSAWYVFSTMGFYPVNPANGQYIFGKPFFDKVTINLENGNTFIIERKGEKSTDAFVKEIYLNGELYSKSYLTHKDIMKGGNLSFIMSKDQQISFNDEDMPISSIDEDLIVSLPSIRKGKRVFRDTTIVVLEAEEGSIIYYKLNDSAECKYVSPIVISANTKMCFRSERNGKQSKTIISNFYKIPKGRKVSLKAEWHKQYSAGGDIALIDGLQGTKNFRTGAWQGFFWEDFEAVVDLGKATSVSKVNISFLQDARSWIWMPEYVEFWGSTDSVSFKPLGIINNDISKYDNVVQIKSFKLAVSDSKYRYIKIFAKNHNICPTGHLGEGGKGFVFTDEIIIE